MATTKKKPSTAAVKKTATKKAAAKKKPVSSKTSTSGEKSELKKQVTLVSSRIERYYSKIVAAFVVLSVILLGLILYFSFSQTVIIIHPSSIDQEITFETTIAELEGSVLLTDVQGEETFAGSETLQKQDAKATGTVTIHNSYTQNQPLISTTRLLSKEGVLFRTAETVTVPAGGSVEVGIIADQEGISGNIDATTFEIVALWDGLKEKIYAESTEPTTGGVVEIASVSETDIANAKKELTTTLLDGSMERFEEAVADYEDPVIFADEPTVATYSSNTADTLPGSEVSTFTITQELTAALPFVSESKLQSYVQERIAEHVPDSFELAEEVSIDDITISIDSINEENTDGHITITVATPTKIRENSDLLRADNVTNKTANEVQAYFQGFEEVESVDVKFSPFWVQKTPSIPESITIEIIPQVAQ